MALNKEKAQESFVGDVITVVSSDLIKITEDKLENILNKNVQKMKKPKDILTSFGLCISLYSLVFEANLNDIGGFSGETIRGFFLLLLVISIFFFLCTVFNSIFNRVTASNIIREIKHYGKKQEGFWEKITQWFQTRRTTNKQ